MTWMDASAAVVVAVEALTVLFLLGMALYQLELILRYRRTRGPDPEPPDVFAKDALPHVTVQLPVYNEGIVAGRCLRSAADLDYPTDRLEIQFLDDSDDGVTSELALRTIEAVRRARPGLVVRYLRRPDRSDFKAGALRHGTAVGRGELLAVFDADFVIPRDFLMRTVHHFRDARTGAVQARWTYLNRDDSLFHRLQATKLDAHQMFEQVARARSDRAVIFHGTAGIWRRSALEEAGGWNCVSEVEDVEVSVRAALQGTRIVYLDHLRVPSELPGTVDAFLRQQMRWKRGWIRVVRHYTRRILRSRAPLRLRLDLLQRIQLSWGPAGALVMTLGALPFFLAVEHLGLTLPGIALYGSTLLVSLASRHLEEKTLREDPRVPAPPPSHRVLGWMPWGYLLGLGTSWALTQATFQGFRSQRIWEVTPKSGTSPGSAGHRGAAPGRLPGYAVGTLAVGASGVVLLTLSVATGHLLAGLFYVMLAVGCGWIGLSVLRDRAHGPGPAPVACPAPGRRLRP